MATTSLEAVRARLRAAAEAAGREPGSVRLLAVSKAQPAEALRAAYGEGQREFGENYAQELAAKGTALADLKDLRFVFIGTVQSNKIALIVKHAAEIQSLASERHARLVAKHASALGKTPYPVYLLVNAGDEATKSGLTFAAAAELAALISRDLPELRVQGLMAIPPPLAPTVLTPPALYKKLRDAASVAGAGLLSLGMSQDLEIAVAAGSDCVRIGTAVFGERKSHGNQGDPLLR